MAAYLGMLKRAPEASVVDEDGAWKRWAVQALGHVDQTLVMGSRKDLVLAMQEQEAGDLPEELGVGAEGGEDGVFGDLFLAGGGVGDAVDVDAVDVVGCPAVADAWGYDDHPTGWERCGQREHEFGRSIAGFAWQRRGEGDDVQILRRTLRT